MPLTTPITLKYLAAYAPEVKTQVMQLLNENRLEQFILKKYPRPHNVANDKDLRDFVLKVKNRYMKNSAAVTRILFDKKIHVINNALGLHSYVTRNHGGKLKRTNEIRIGAVFKKAPEEFLSMIVVHELAHLKEKEHDKAFYQLCQNMLPNYHQLEFEMRLYLTQLELKGDIYC